ncbi:MAG: YcjF family protein [Rhizobiaceae bacterium]
MTTPRKPQAFRIDPEPQPEIEPLEPRPVAEARKPRAMKAEMAVVTPAEIDVFDETDGVTDIPPPVEEKPRRSLWLRLFLGAFGILVSLAVGLWTDSLIRTLFDRADWLGWFALAMAGLAALALVVMIIREAIGLARLASVENLRRQAEDALARNDPKLARSVVDSLSAFVADKPETAAGRRLLEAQKGEIVDGGDLLRLAETDILAPLDAIARTMILDAAKRVSLVTAVSPRALVDIGYVLYEAAKLIRGLAALYGGRPGTLGFFRLARNVLAHLAVTGSIAVGDSFVQQIVGHGLAARLSAKLGEGVVNGMMTARIGMAAMETARPLPFSALKRPGMGDFLAALTRFASANGGPKS